MAAIQISESSTEPVTTAEVKLWAKIEHDDEDAVISSLITSSRIELERYLKRALITQVWREFYDQIQQPIYSPLVPLTALSVAVEDDAGNYIETEAVVKFDQSTGRVRVSDAVGYGALDSVQVTYTSTVTGLKSNLRAALLELVSYRFYNRGNIVSSAIPATVQAMVGHMRVVSI